MNIVLKRVNGLPIITDLSLQIQLIMASLTYISLNRSSGLYLFTNRGYSRIEGFDSSGGYHEIGSIGFISPGGSQDISAEIMPLIVLQAMNFLERIKYRFS